MTHETHNELGVSGKRALHKCIDEIACSLLLITTGALWLAPNAWVPEGTWLTCFGIVLLGVNATRYLFKLRIEAFGLVLGSVALIAGISQILGGKLAFIPLFLVVMGTATIIKTIATKEKRHEPCIFHSR